VPGVALGARGPRFRGAFVLVAVTGVTVPDVGVEVGVRVDGVATNVGVVEGGGALTI